MYSSISIWNKMLQPRKIMGAYCMEASEEKTVTREHKESLRTLVAR